MWNMDLVTIASIIAAIGTVLDDQLIITDEVLKRRDSKESKKSRRSASI